MTDNTADQVKCPYCAEAIQREAIKCKHCGEWLTERTAPPVPQTPSIPPPPEVPERAKAESDADRKKESKPKRRSWSWLMAITGGIAAGFAVIMLAGTLGYSAFVHAWAIEPVFTLLGFVMGGLSARLLPPKEGPPWRWGWTVTMIVVFLLPWLLWGHLGLRVLMRSSGILALLLFVAWPASLFQFSRKKADRAATDGKHKRKGDKQ